MLKDIYVIRNDINDKVYVGQTRDINNRWLHHVYDARHEAKINNTYSPLHVDMIKYGIEHFYYEIIESRVENFDEREAYWIKLLNSQVPNGYNISPGSGNGSQGIYASTAIFKTEQELLHCISQISSSKKTFDNIAKEYGCCLEVICAINSGERYHIDGMQYPLRRKKYAVELLKQVRYSLKYEEDLTLSDIAQKYKIDYSQVSLINQGKIYYVDSEDYPIRKKRKRDLDEKVVLAIIDDIMYSDLCFSDIAAKYNVSPMCITNINTGYSYHHDNIVYPIRDQLDPRTKSTKKFLTMETIDEITTLLKTDMSIKEIANKFGVSDTMINCINNGKIKKYYREDYQYPIRKKK